MSREKNDNEWLYKLKAAHKMELDKCKRETKEATQKNTHLALEIAELNKKLEEEKLLKKEIEEGFIKLRQKYFEFDSESISHTFFKKEG